MSEEITYLLDRLGTQRDGDGARPDRLAAEKRWWRTAPHRSLLELAQRSFLTRQVCRESAETGGTWRSSGTYIGDPDPADAAICTYEYDRSECFVPAASPLSRPYAWADTAELQTLAMYTRSGMSAINAWLLAVARLAAQQETRHLLLTNRLYFETAALFEMASFRYLTVRSFASIDEVIAASAEADEPAVLYLDSSRPGGDPESLTRALLNLDPGQVRCVAWDSTCVPVAEGPVSPELSSGLLTVPLIVLRSHSKLDQLGMEFCPLGSIALVTQPDTDPGSAPWRKGLEDLLPETLGITGGAASPGSLRLMTALGLPSPVFAARGNRHLRAANRLGGRLLADLSAHDDRYRVDRPEHEFFAEIHVLDHSPPDIADKNSPFMRRIAGVEDLAARHSIPVWKSGSFGFHYTALDLYSSALGNWSPVLTEAPHITLRVAFGGHDVPMATQVAQLIIDGLTERRR